MSIEVDTSELKDFARLANRKAKDVKRFLKDTTDELAEQVRAGAAAKTNVVTGRMRENWRMTEAVSIISATGYGYQAEVYNDVISPARISATGDAVEGEHYAGHVNYGHVIRRVKDGPILGKVKGQYMMQRSEQEVEKKSRQFIEAKLAEFLRDL
jgi:hypothetical protein